MKAVSTVIDYAASGSKKVIRSFSGRKKSKGYSIAPFPEDPLLEESHHEGVPEVPPEGSSQDESYHDESSPEGTVLEGACGGSLPKGTFEDVNPQLRALHEAFDGASLQKSYPSLKEEKLERESSNGEPNLREGPVDTSSRRVSFSRDNSVNNESAGWKFEPNFHYDSGAGGSSPVSDPPKKPYPRRTSKSATTNTNAKRVESIPMVGNRSSFKKKQTKFPVFGPSMKTHERRESLQKNLPILTEISNITHVSSELPLVRYSEGPSNRGPIQESPQNSQRSGSSGTEPPETKGPIQEPVITDPSTKSEESSLNLVSIRADNEVEAKIAVRRKKKKPMASENQRNLVSKAGQKENNDSRRSKAQKKSAMKSSMSLIDLVVASAEKKYRWSTVPESEDDYWMKDKVYKVKSRLVRSSSTSSINASAKETLPEQESWHGSREEEGGRKKTVSSVGDSDAMTTTDYEDEDEEGGARWRDSEVSLEKKKKLHALKNLSRSTPAMSPSGSPRHSDSEVPARLSRINKMFRKRFSSVTTNEKVINYYACAIVSDILLQGTLYITENYFAFYSNIFGYVNRTVLPIADVASIQKEKTAKFIPNAVGIQMFDGKTYVFSSLISRDSTYKFMIHTWRKSRKLTDSDSEPPFIIPGTNEDVSVEEEEEEEESELNSVDSNGDEDMVDSGPIEETSVSSRNVPVWSRSSPTIVSNSYETQSSAANSNSGHVTPLTPLNDTFPEVSSSGTFESSKSYSKKSSQNAAPSEAQSSSNHWIVHTKIINSVLHVGVAPFQAVREGLQEITFLPKSSVLLVVSSALVFLLLASAAFMIYRVELLSQHLSFSPSDEFSSNLYEEVLRMQQKLHSATAEEVEKTLSMQIKQLATVRQSLDALTFLFNKDPARPTPQLQENT